MSAKLIILVIEDSEDDQLLYERYIKRNMLQTEQEIIVCETGGEGIEFLLSNSVDCVLLDYKLPDMTGIEVLSAMSSGLPNLPPVVMLTGVGNENVAVQALKLGAYDYLSKSDLQEEVLIKAIANATEKSTLSKNISIKNKEISKMSNFDLLTGLPNRTKFEYLLRMSLETNGENYHAIYMVDLDRFKSINDTKGHEYGDLVLREVSSRFKKSLPKEVVLARFGGDEFAALVDVVAKEDALDIAKEFSESLSAPIQIGEDNELMAVSVGVAVTPYAGTTVQDLLKNADTALFHAKESGKNTYKFFSKEMETSLGERAQIAMKLNGAVARNEFHLVYQPIYNINASKLHAAEVLVRWNNPELGMVPPDKFIPIAEENGLINEVGDWIIDTALSQLCDWHKEINPDIKLSINISPKQTKRADWLKSFKKKLDQYSIAPEKIIIELTETAIVSDIHHTSVVLTRIHKIGCPIFLDDFGTGYSSLNLVRQLPITGLKIDKSYVQDLVENSEDAVLVKSIMVFAEVLNLAIVAEGVETESQLEFLKQVSIKENYAQGYFLSKPLVKDDIEGIFAT